MFDIFSLSADVLSLGETSAASHTGNLQPSHHQDKYRIAVLAVLKNNMVYIPLDCLHRFPLQ